MSYVRIEIDGEIKSGYILRDGHQYWFHYSGRTFLVEDENSRSAKKIKKSGSATQIVAPMPGKIIKTFVKPKDLVHAGDVLVVMEAMKMEYSLKAEVDGSVQTIACAEGDQVSLGKLLVQLIESK